MVNVGPLPRMAKTDFANAVIAAGGRINLPDWVDEVVFVQDGGNRRYVRLPDPEMVLDARSQLQQPGNTYALPQFYQQPPLNLNLSGLSVAQKLDLQADRIGDYSIGSCA